MWCDHLFNQRNKAMQRAVGLGVGGNKEGGWEGEGGWTKF